MTPRRSRTLPAVLCIALISAASADVPSDDAPTVRIGKKTFTVTIADTEEARVRGLSGSKPLKENQGMLFIFERDARHPIWMKDMRYSLDVLWISRYGAIVHVERNAHPNTYPVTFLPRKPARYVLEVPAGAGRGAKVGDPVYFENVPLVRSSANQLR